MTPDALRKRGLSPGNVPLQLRYLVALSGKNKVIEKNKKSPTSRRGGATSGFSEGLTLQFGQYAKAQAGSRK
jgi:hypothetical protein